jgi:hypothetical protein
MISNNRYLIYILPLLKSSTSEIRPGACLILLYSSSDTISPNNIFCYIIMFRHEHFTNIHAI